MRIKLLRTYRPKVPYILYRAAVAIKCTSCEPVQRCIQYYHIIHVCRFYGALLYRGIFISASSTLHCEIAVSYHSGNVWWYWNEFMSASSLLQHCVAILQRYACKSVQWCIAILQYLHTSQFYGALRYTSIVMSASSTLCGDIVVSCHSGNVWRYWNEFMTARLLLQHCVAILQRYSCKSVQWCIAIVSSTVHCDTEASSCQPAQHYVVTL